MLEDDTSPKSESTLVGVIASASLVSPSKFSAFNRPHFQTESETTTTTSFAKNLSNCIATMAEARSYGILSCASNRYHNFRSSQIQKRKKKKMQTSKFVAPKSHVLPRRLGTPPKLSYGSATIRSNQFEHPAKVAEVKTSSDTKKRAFNPSISIFRARTVGSLIHNDSTDVSDEEDDLLMLRMANPICDSSDDECEEELQQQQPTRHNTKPMPLWRSNRLEEDEIEGFSLGGLMLV